MWNHISVQFTVHWTEIIFHVKSAIVPFLFCLVWQSSTVKTLEKKLAEVTSKIQKAKDEAVAERDESISELQRQVHAMRREHEEAMVLAENDKQQALMLGKQLAADGFLFWTNEISNKIKSIASGNEPWTSIKESFSKLKDDNNFFFLNM